MWVVVLETRTGDQHAGSGERLDDRLIGIAPLTPVGEHAPAGEARRFAGESAVLVDGEGNGGVDTARLERRLVRHPDVEILAAVARRGVHKTGADVVGDVVAFEQGYSKLIAAAAQRMGALDSAKTIVRNV
jgi:hypothetical protein